MLIPNDFHMLIFGSFQRREVHESKIEFSRNQEGAGKNIALNNLPGVCKYQSIRYVSAA